jgi:hypothetical protein
MRGSKPAECGALTIACTEPERELQMGKAAALLQGGYAAMLVHGADALAAMEPALRGGSGRYTTYVSTPPPIRNCVRRAILVL